MGEGLSGSSGSSEATNYFCCSPCPPCLCQRPLSSVRPRRWTPMTRATRRRCMSASAEAWCSALRCPVCCCSGCCVAHAKFRGWIATRPLPLSAVCVTSAGHPTPRHPNSLGPPASRPHSRIPLTNLHHTCTQVGIVRSLSKEVWNARFPASGDRLMLAVASLPVCALVFFGHFMSAGRARGSSEDKSVALVLGAAALRSSLM